MENYICDSYTFEEGIKEVNTKISSWERGDRTEPSGTPAEVNGGGRVGFKGDTEERGRTKKQQ